MYYVTVTSTVDDGRGGRFAIEHIGPFEHGSELDAWINRFWAELDKMNERLGLRTEPIGAELLSKCHPFGARGIRRPVTAWDPSSAVGVIAEQYKRLNLQVRKAS